MYRRASVWPIERPVVPFILCLIGGLFVLAGGAYGLVYLGTVSYYNGGAYLVFDFLGIVSGGLVLLAAAMLYAAPPNHVAWGIVAIVFSVISIFSGPGNVFGGFFVGMVLGIVGGAMAIAWRSGGELSLMDTRTCLTCGRHVLAAYPVCPHCGTPAPAAGATLAAKGPSSPPPP